MPQNLETLGPQTDLWRNLYIKSLLSTCWPINNILHQMDGINITIYLHRPVQ